MTNKRSASNAGRPKVGGSKLKQTVSVTGQHGKGRIAKKPRVSQSPEGSDGDDGDDDGDDEVDDDEAGTDEEIERSKKGKAKATQKRKRPTTADDFGSALTTLLAESSRPVKSKPKGKTDDTTDAPTAGPSKVSTKVPRQQPILSLSRAALPPSVAESKLERRAARQLKQEKEEKEDRARVRDVVEGWAHVGAGGEVIGGLEFEKGLRKTAQRGVIKLFNAILTAHKHTEANDLTIPSASAAKYRDVPIPGIKGFGKKDKDNIMGRGSRQELTKEGFLELVKRGTA